MANYPDEDEEALRIKSETQRRLKRHHFLFSCSLQADNSKHFEAFQCILENCCHWTDKTHNKWLHHSLMDSFDLETEPVWLHKWRLGGLLVNLLRFKSSLPEAQTEKALTECFQRLQCWVKNFSWMFERRRYRIETTDWLKISVVFLLLAPCSLPHNQIQTAHLHNCE